MTDTAPTCALEYKILSTNSEALTAEVQFLNPRYTGNFIVVEEYQESVEESDETVTKTREKDEDPYPHATKTINVPVKDGKVDQDELNRIIEAQARGVKHRMDAQHVAKTKKPLDLDKALGL